MSEQDFTAAEVDFPEGQSDFEPDAGLPIPPHPINWNLLSSVDLEAELLELNRWIDWLRHTYGLPASVIPPLWHRHSELLWELSALHLHWLAMWRGQRRSSLMAAPQPFFTPATSTDSYPFSGQIRSMIWRSLNRHWRKSSCTTTKASAHHEPVC